MHFNNHTSLKSEGGHAQLKAKLKISTGNLMSGVEKVDQRCNCIRRDYINKLENTKQQLDYQLRKPLYQDLMVYVTPYVLQSINFHYTRLLEVEKKGLVYHYVQD